MESIVNLMNSKDVLELACQIIAINAENMTDSQKEQLASVLKGSYPFLPHSPPSPFLCEAPLLEEKPDTLLENSCGVCGASYVDHGELACNDYGCLYNVRNGFGEGEEHEDYEDHEDTHEDADDEAHEDVHEDADDEADDAHADAETEEDVPVNWVQCDTCDTWRKVPSLENMTNEWHCSHIKKACRAPSEAENHWPATRAKYAVKFCYWGSAYRHLCERKPYQGNRAPSHMECLKILAERQKITLEELYKTRPETYFRGHFNAFSRFMHGDTHSAYYFWS
jgi:hypothetical protein